MNEIFQTPKVYIKNSLVSGAGRGVFARQNISQGEVIEICPTIMLTEYDLAALGESILVTYFFFYGAQKEKALLLLGFGSLYNHSHTPNAAYQIQQDGSTVSFIAIRDIAHDEEITFDYKSGNPKSSDPLWFEV